MKKKTYLFRNFSLYPLKGGTQFKGGTNNLLKYKEKPSVPSLPPFLTNIAILFFLIKTTGIIRIYNSILIYIYTRNSRYSRNNPLFITLLGVPPLFPLWARWVHSRKHHNPQKNRAPSLG